MGEEVRYGAMVKGIHGSGRRHRHDDRRGQCQEVVSLIKAQVADINSQGMLPGGLQIVPYYDRSELVEAALNTVSKVLIEGIVLVVIILFLYLGDLRSSLIVIATLVLTPAATFLVMNYYGMSANLMSLGGLAIAIGLIVDGSVVVVENIFSRLGERPGTSRMKTVYDATVEVGTPVIFGIGVIILVFLPLMTLEGMEGKMFAPLAYTITIALGISLVLSLTLSPVLSFYMLKGGGEHDTLMVKLTKRPYLRIVSWAVNNPKTVISLALLLFALSVLGLPYLGTSFIPELKEGTISPNMDRVPNIALDESIKMEQEAIQRILKIPGVKHVVSRLGRGESPVDPAGYNESDMMIQLQPLQERHGLTQDQIADQVREITASFPGVNPVMAQPISDRVDEMVTGVRADIAVKVFGDDLETLVKIAGEIARTANTIRGTSDFKIDRVKGQQNLNVVIDRQAIARHGLNASDVHDAIEAAVAGKAATEIYEGERRFQAVVRYPEHLRNNITEIRRLMLRSHIGAQVPLESLAQIELKEGTSQIKRESAKRRIVIGINVRDRDLGGYVAELQKKVRQEVSLPTGYHLEWGGQFENMQRAQQHLMVIVPVTVGAIFFLLFLLFRSVRLASLIILVLPFASVGGIVGLLVSGEYLSVPASVGFIALWGIAVLNGVVLVSYVRSQRQAGMEQQQAILDGAKMRFRPVMMTATVAALGLAPFHCDRSWFGSPASGHDCRHCRLGEFHLLTLVVPLALYGYFEPKMTPEAGAGSPNLA
ncbi:MAG: efflux RND transporter permease subunit [Terriglobia bacterium]